MPANVDFARFNFQVPTAGSAAGPAAMSAPPLVRSTARNALPRSFFANVYPRVLGSVAPTLLMLVRVFISFSPTCVGGLSTLFHQLQWAQSILIAETAVGTTSCEPA